METFEIPGFYCFMYATYPNDVIARMPYMQKANYEELLQMLPHKWKEIKNDGDTTIDGCINSSFLD